MTLTLTTAGVVQAQTSNPTSTPPQRAPERAESASVERSERRADLSERTQERIVNLAANLSNRFDTVIFRLENILTRLDSRLTKIEATGRDVTGARAHIETARNSLTLAKTNLLDIDGLVNDFATAADAQTAWKTVGARYAETRALIRSAHTDIRSAILIVKNPVTPSAVAPETE